MKWMTALAGVIVLTGCAGKQKSTAPTAAPVPETALSTSEVDTVALRAELVLLADQIGAQIAGTTSEIARLTDDPRVREQTILFKLRVIPTLHRVTLQPDVRVSYLYSWMTTLRMRDYVATGEGKAMFGDQQHLIVTTAEEAVQATVGLGRKYFPKEVMDEVEDDIEAITAANPMGAVVGAELQLPAGTTEEQRGAIDSLLGAPVRGLEGVGSTPEAISQVTESIDRLMRLVQQMPQLARWQTELLLLQVQSQPASVELRENVTRISRSIETVAQTVETLPADVRKELDAALAEARETIEALDTTLTKAQAIAADVNQATANVQATTETVNTIVAAVVPPPSERPPPVETEPGEPFDMKDVVKTTEQLHATTVELRAIVEDLQSGVAQDLLAQVDTASKTTIDHAVAQTNTIVDRLTIRLLYLVGAVLVMLVIYRVVAVKMIRPTPR